MPVEDYTSYTEVDIPADRIQFVGTNHLDFNPDRDEEVYLYKDKTAAHFTDFTHDVNVKGQDPSNQALTLTYVVANRIVSWLTIWTDGDEHIAIAMEKFHASGTRRIALYAKPAVTTYDKSGTLVVGTWYYLRLIKSGTSIKLGIYSTAELRDAGDATDGDVDSLVVTLSSDQSYQYIYACSSWNSGDAGVDANIDIEDLNLNEVISLPASTSILLTMQVLGVI